MREHQRAGCETAITRWRLQTLFEPTGHQTLGFFEHLSGYLIGAIAIDVALPAV